MFKLLGFGGEREGGTSAREKIVSVTYFGYCFVQFFVIKKPNNYYLCLCCCFPCHVFNLLSPGTVNGQTQLIGSLRTEIVFCCGRQGYHFNS